MKVLEKSLKFLFKKGYEPCITQHFEFHAFLISYANILTSYTLLIVAKTSLSNRLLLFTDVALIFVTFQLKHNYPLSPTIIFRQAPSAVDKIVPLVHILLTASHVIPFTLQVKHAQSLHTLLVTLKTLSTWFNATVVINNIQVKLSDVSRTDLTNIDVQSTKLTLNLNPLLFLNTFSLTLTILILTCS